MRRLFSVAVGIALMLGTAHAASDDSKLENTGGTAKGAAVGAHSGA